MKRVIVSGATSMIGSALIRLLAANNIEVLALCRPSSEKLKNIISHENVEIMPMELESLSTLSAGDKKYDAFFHFGWVGTYGAARNDFALQSQNVKYSIEALHAAKRLGCKCFIGAGSQAEYGAVASGVKLSPSTPTHPQTAYGKAKLEASLLTRSEAKKLGIRHVWMRILSVYGPNDNSYTAVMQTINRLRSDGHMPLTGGEQMWDYLYCDDAAEAFYGAAQRGKDGAVYVLGSGVCAPLRSYFETIRDICAPSATLGFGEIEYAVGQTMYLCADISALKHDVGFEPKVKFDEGITNILKGLSQ